MRVLAFLLLLFVLPCSAAELPVGKWTGSYSFPEDDPLQVKYQVNRVKSEAEELEWAITMDAAGVAIAFSKIQLSAEQLSFRMNPGEEVACVLKLGVGGIYKGTCRSVASPEATQKIRIFMRPPAGEGEAAENESDSSEDESEPEADSSVDQPT